MELPLGGPALRHYTQSRPRPHRQKLNYRPSRPQETIIESDNEVLELMGRVDEGVEEFFTKRVLPPDTPKKQEEEPIKVQEVAPASSVPCPPPTKTLRRKLGDFFTLKKRRGLKSETSQEGRPKKASIADLIRPLREVTRAEKEKDKDRVKEHDKENEKEKTKDAVTGESAVQETPGAALRGEVVPPRRALREGKSQSLILLSGSAAAGTTNARNTSKKQFEGQHSFEQKLHLMLQRIGVSKAQPEESQNQEGEMKKAESEGTIIDSKPEPPPTFTKPRTMSASSDTRHHIRPSVSAHEAAGKPALLPKPVIKPGPPTTSGRNTPENELAQIQEGEATTPTKPSPTAAPSAPPAHTSTTTTTTTPTISDSAPDSTDITSTVPPSDSDTRTDSLNVPKTNATTAETPTSTSLTTPTSTTTPTEPLATVLVTSPSSVSITNVTSDSTTPTIASPPSISTVETVSVPTTESSTAPTNVLASPNSVDATPTAAGVDAAVAVIASPPSDTPPGLSAATSSVPETCDDSSAKSSVAKTLASPSDLSQAITTAVSSTSTSTPYALPPTTSISATATTTSPTSTDSVLTPTTPQPTSPSPAEITVPSTSSSETNPTDTPSTASSLYRADTTSTSSSANAAAICSPHMTDSVPPDTDDSRTSVTPTTDASSAISDHLTKPAASDDRPEEPQTTPEQKSTVERGEETTDKETVQNNEQTEMDEGQKVKDVGKDVDNEKEKAARTSDGEVIIKEVQEESVKPDERVKSQKAEPASGEDKLSGKMGATEGQKQDEGEK